MAYGDENYVGRGGGYRGEDLERLYREIVDPGIDTPLDETQPERAVRLKTAIGQFPFGPGREPGREVVRRTEALVPPSVQVEPEISTLTPMRGREGISEGFWEWTKDGQRFVSNTEGGAPSGAKFVEFSKPVTELDGAKLYGEQTPETMEALRRVGESDEQREERHIENIMEKTGADYAAASRAFKTSQQQVTAGPGAPKDYEGKVALRNQIVQNIYRTAQRSQSEGERQNILKQGLQFLKMHNLHNLKKSEQTITATIEGQQVAIPVSEWKSEFGAGGTGKGTANIKEATWLINKGIAKSEKEAYAMVKKAMAKDTTEKEWALGVRRRLNKKVDEGFLVKEEYDQAYQDEIDFFRGLQQKTAIPAEGRVSGPNKTAWIAEAQRRNPDASTDLLERAYQNKFGG